MLVYGGDELGGTSEGEKESDEGAMDGDEGCVEVCYWVVGWGDYGCEVGFEGFDVGWWDEGCSCEGFGCYLACVCEVWISHQHTVIYKKVDRKESLP